MANIFEALRDFSVGNYCTLTTPLANGLQGLEDKLGGPLGDGGGGELADNVNLFRGAQQIYCGRFPNSPDEIADAIAPPFDGGQCPGTLYDIDGRQTGNFGVQNFTISAYGPVGPPQSRPNGNNVDWFYVAQDFDGNTVEFGLATNTSPDREYFFDTLTPADGGPNDCGNLPPELPPFVPGDNTVTAPLTYDDNDGNEVTTPVTIEFGPVEVSPTGQFEVPFDVTFNNDAPLIGELNLSTGGVNIGLGGGGANGGGGSGGSGEEDLRQPTELPDDVDPEEENKLIMGVRVLAVVDQSVTTATEIFQDGGNPNIYAPRLGHVAFKYRLSNGSEGWGEDIPVKNLEEIIWAPEDAVSVKGTANQGATFTLFPIQSNRRVE